MQLKTPTDLTIEEVSAMAGISTKTVRRLISSGRLDVVRHNQRVIRVPISSWTAYRENALTKQAPSGHK